MDSYNIRESIFLPDSQLTRHEPNLVVMSPAYGYYHTNEIRQSDIHRYPGQMVGNDVQRTTSLHTKPNIVDYVPEPWQKNLSASFYDRPNNQAVMDYSLNAGPEKYGDGHEQDSLKAMDLQEQLKMKHCHETNIRNITEHQDKGNGIRDSHVINQSVPGDSSNFIHSSNKQQEVGLERVKCSENFDTKPYTCGQCGKQFDIVCSLHQHMLTHKSSGLYMFNIDTRTAYFRNDGICKAVQTLDRPDNADEEKLKIIQQEQHKSDVEESVSWQANDVDCCNKEVDESVNLSATCKRKLDIDKGHMKSVPKKTLKNKTKRKKADLKDKIKSSKVTRTKCKRSEKEKSVIANTGEHESEKMTLRKVETNHVRCDNENIADRGYLNGDKDLDSYSNCSDETLDLDYVPPTLPGQDKSFECGECGKTFKSEAKLNLHQNRYHTDIDIDDIEQVSHSCKWCQETFPSRKLVFEHVKNCLQNDRLKCCICGVIIPNKAERIKHLQSHDNRSDLTCKICNKVLNSLVLMQAHMKRHNRKNAVQCDQCGKAFLYKHLLKKHAAYCHNEHPVDCPKCDKKFKTKEAMNHHISVHSEEKMYVCHFCGYTGKKLNYLKRHIRTHTGERPYSCNICGKTFVAPNGLNRHKKIHTNQNMSVCQYCGKSFTNNWNLKTHLRQHTGDTPYKCRECGMGFKQNVLVKLHMKSHHPSI